MVRKTLEQRIAQLEAKKQTLKARLTKEQRAKDTRRKILLGALLLDRLESKSNEMSHTLNTWVRQELPGFLTRDSDKELFEDFLK